MNFFNLIDAINQSVKPIAITYNNIVASKTTSNYAVPNYE